MLAIEEMRSTAAARNLADLETVIERGQQTFVEVGQALMEIRDGRLYREHGYPTFEDYCQQRWGWQRRQAYNYIDAADVFQNVHSNAHNPPSLTQAVQLAPLLPQQQQEIARRVDFANTTVRELREQVREFRQEPQPEPSRLAIHYSSDSAEWYTPPEIIQRVLRIFGEIDTDPCSNSGEHPNVPATWRFTQADDGLTHVWRGRVYMNPPYGRVIDDWAAKLCSEYEAGNTTAAIALVPARTDTDWFRRFRDFAVCFIDGRLKFSGMSNSAPFPSAVVYLGKDIDAFARAFSDMGDIWVRFKS